MARSWNKVHRCCCFTSISIKQSLFSRCCCCCCYRCCRCRCCCYCLSGDRPDTDWSAEVEFQKLKIGKKLKSENVHNARNRYHKIGSTTLLGSRSHSLSHSPWPSLSPLSFESSAIERVYVGLPERRFCVEEWKKISGGIRGKNFNSVCSTLTTSQLSLSLSLSLSLHTLSLSLISCTLFHRQYYYVQRQL